MMLMLTRATRSRAGSRRTPEWHRGRIDGRNLDVANRCTLSL